MGIVVGSRVEEEVVEYLSAVVRGMGPEPSGARSADAHAASLADEIFELLTSREFCYLGRTRAEPYREQVTGLLRRRMQGGEAFRFFYDIGPGYHATTRPGVVPLRFDVGLSELLILSQVSALCRRIATRYAPGARFWLVVDNVCALRTNDIPLERTEAYVGQLRELIESTGVSDVVDLIVESEQFTLEEYDAALAARPVQPPAAPTAEAVDNVARFLGRPCTTDEAARRIELYARTGPVTDGLVDRLVHGVHMTQRATGATLGFRPFPGGDQRTQAGELALTHDAKGRLRPTLLTTRNIDRFACTPVEVPDTLAPPLRHVTYAVGTSDA